MSWSLVSYQKFFARRTLPFVYHHILVSEFDFRFWLSCTQLCWATEPQPQPEPNSTITLAPVPLTMKRKILVLPIGLALKLNHTLPPVLHLPLLFPPYT